MREQNDMVWIRSMRLCTWICTRKKGTKKTNSKFNLQIYFSCSNQWRSPLAIKITKIDNCSNTGTSVLRTVHFCCVFSREWYNDSSCSYLFSYLLFLPALLSTKVISFDFLIRIEFFVHRWSPRRFCCNKSNRWLSAFYSFIRNLWL